MENQFDIADLFSMTKKIYDTNKSFYISSTPLDGLQLGVYQDPRPFTFSEYVFGNSRDMKIVVENARRNVFKSFYCSMCTIEEKDNVSAFNSCGILQHEENVALKINQHVVYNGIPFLISGTAPQYYYNHLLLSSLDHYSTYMIFENKDLFRGVAEFSADLARQNSAAKLIFNGTFGSDIWHFHAHITDTAIGYVDLSPEVPKIVKPIEEKNGSFGVVNYKIVGGTDLDAIFNRVYQLTRLIYSPAYMSQQRYLSSVFKTVIRDGKVHFFVFLITGNKSHPEISEYGQYRLFFPAAALNIGYSQMTAEKFGLIKKSIIEKGCYSDWRNVNEISHPKKSTRVEFFEQAFRKKCNINYLGIPDVQNIFQTVDKCILGKKSCGIENSDVFATYKYTISLLFICMVQSTGKSEKRLEQMIYKKLIADPKFLHHALKSGISYLTHNYDITNSRSLFLRGPVASEVLATSFNNFGLLTSYDTKISTKTLTKQSRKVTDWLNFNPNTRIGNDSAMGIVFSSSLQYSPEIEFVMKTVKPHRRNPKEIELFFSEFAVGTKINNLRQNVPNFVLTLGGFECYSNPLLRTLCQEEPGSEILQFILLEKIDNAISFGDYVSRSDVSTGRLCLAITQIAAGLEYAQKSLDFTHYDLHVNNIMVTNLVPSGGDPELYRYRIGEKEYPIPAYVNCTIIDYGTSHVKNLDRYVDMSEKAYGWTLNRPNFNRDIFSLIMSTFLQFLATRSAADIDDFYRNENPLKFLVGNLFNAYADIFHPNAFFIVKAEYEKVFTKITDVPGKAGFLVKLLTNARKDKLYYLYLPENYPSPTTGMYKNLSTFIETVSNVGAIPYSKILTNPAREFQWGDFTKPGCFMKTDTRQTKEREILTLKKFVEANKAKTPPKAKKRSPAKTKKDSTPKAKVPSPPKAKKESPPKAKKASPPKEKVPSPPKAKAPEPSLPKFKKKSPAKEVPSEKEKRLLREMTDILSSKIDKFSKVLDEDGVPVSSGSSLSACKDLTVYFEKFWSKSSGRPEKLLTKTDRSRFKKYALFSFHPDRVPEGKKTWAAQMSQNINLYLSECAKHAL